MISYDLKGKTALVTGGASGIGFATARMMAKFGATVAVNFLVDDPRGPEAVDKINAEGGKAIMAPGSVSEAGVAHMLELVPHARTFDVAEAGHMVAGDDNDIFCVAVEGFLRDLQPRA